ncbi:MAG: hypothetical protein HWE34_00260 [Methylocystaceae bacterium]|nr:hypothetical protein [Methylocystaceae bacterium]
MNIGSISTAALYQVATQQPSAEAREVGPDNDGDSDDAQTNTTAPSSGNTTADRGNSVNILA